MPALFQPAFASLDATVLAAFGEECWFIPKTGNARQITAAVDQGTATVDDEHSIYTEERLEILVARSAAGIAAVAIGDGFRRATDPEGTVYAYTGEKIDVNDAAWKLAFVRRIPYQKGGNNLR